MTDPASPAPPSPSLSAPGATASDRAGGLDWDTITRLAIIRDSQTGWISGTCSGIAARYDVDPLLIRAAVIALTFTGGIGVPLYLAGWLLLPDTSGRILLRETGSGAAAPVVLIVAFVLSLIVALGFSTQNGTFGLPPGLVAVAVAGGLFYYARRHQAPPTSIPPPPPVSGPAPAGYAAPPPLMAATSSRTPALPVASPATWTPGPATYPAGPTPGVHPQPVAVVPRRRPRAAPRGTGLLVLAIVLGSFWAAAAVAPSWGLGHAPWVAGLVAALAAASVCALLLGLSGRRGGLATVLTVLLIGPALIAAPIARFGPTVTESAIQDWSPQAAGASLDVGVSDVHVDLSSLPTNAAGGAPLSLQVAAGTVTIDVPADLPLVLTLSVGAGEVNAGPFTPAGESRVVDGVGLDRMITLEPGASTTAAEPVHLQVEVGVGSIMLQAAPTAIPTPSSTP